MLWKKMSLLLLLLTGLAGSTGCKMMGMAMYPLLAERKEKIPAEYEDLEGKKICTWVWADEAALFEFPTLKLDVANHASYFIRQHIKCDFVDAVAVERFQRTNYDSDQLSVVEIGQRFNADAVLFIEIIEFQVHPSGARSMVQGKLTAQCSLYKCTGDLPVESRQRQVWDGEINVTYPEGRPISVRDASPQYVRSATLKVFAAALAKKFYSHYEPLGDQ